MSESKNDATTKFANVHYPGMQIDPREGQNALDPGANWRFAEQIACIGEASQRRLLEASVFVIDGNALGVSIARKLFQFGIGRVGIFGEKPVSGAIGIVQPELVEMGTLRALSKLVRSEQPWAQFEPFRDASIERTVEDMAHGFEIVVAAGGMRQAAEALVSARSVSQSFVAAHVAGREAWCVYIPAGVAICEDCLEVPVSSQSGLYFPLVDVAANWAATLVLDAALGQAPGAAFVESFDAQRSPWLREVRACSARPGCTKCSAKS